MSKPEWGELQQQYTAAHSRTGISVADWCAEYGLNYATARRYIKKNPQNAQIKVRKIAQKTAQKQTAQSAQKQPEKSAEKKSRISAESKFLDDVVLEFNPHEFGLTEQQGYFAWYVSQGNNLTESYRLSEYEGVGNVAWAAASRLFRNVKVARAIRWLRDRRQKRLALTESEIIHQLSSIASADPSLISQVRRVNCRYCWGDDHQYQWRDVGEYERAVALAVKDAKAEPEFGGIGFVDSGVPNPECPRCGGEGRMETFFADTSMLDGPERWLVTGVKETMNGLEIKTASPEAARRELLKIIRDSRGNSPGITADMSPEEFKQARREMLEDDDC